MTIEEFVICGASLDTICTGKLPEPDMAEIIRDAFAQDWQAPGGWRILPRVLRAGEDEEEDLADDGTYRRMPHPIRDGDKLVRGAIVCTACYVTLCLLSPSGQGLTHELQTAIEKAWGMKPADLPAIR